MAFYDQKAEKQALKKARQAEAARLRYHRLSPEEKKELNLKRTQAQKLKRQREKELAELEVILRASNDIVDDPQVVELLREKHMRVKWAEAARTRYQRMTSEQRKDYNSKRRTRNVSKNQETSVPQDEATVLKIKAQNARKAEVARLRYHRMTSEEKKLYNQRRTEAFRRRRLEEENLLAMPIGRINGEALDRAQQIVIRNARRAESARLRYQRMTPEERRTYNQKRYVPKQKKMQEQHQPVVSSAEFDEESNNSMEPERNEQDEALAIIEKDLLRRTQQAQRVLLQQNSSNYVVVSPATTTSIGSQSIFSQIIQPIQLGSQQIVIQQPSSSVNSHPKIINVRPKHIPGHNSDSYHENLDIKCMNVKHNLSSNSSLTSS